MAKCRDCEAPILWAEIETRNGIKKIAMDPAPSSKGDLILRNQHPDQPMRASKVSSEDRRLNRPTYVSHRETCPEVDLEDRKKYDRDPSWVREPEGY